MTEGLYFGIGGISALTFFSLVILMWVGAALAACRAFITEKDFTYPMGGLIANCMGYILLFPKMAEDFYAFNDNDLEGKGCVSLIYGMSCMLVLLVWPVIPVIYFIYGLLRLLRFSYRIKTAIVKLVTRKKCLAEYTDKDTPSINF